MLVLTRKSQETIRIGNDTTVSILKVKGRAVRIGIEAPGKVRVVRGELTALEQDENPGTAVSEKSDTQGSARGESESDIVTSFAPQEKISTRSVNRILASRQNERRSKAPLAQALQAVTRARSASWNEMRHLSVG
jgi:carbon storage regulator